MRLLSNLLSTCKPGELLAADRGEVPWPHAVFGAFWPISRSDSFSPKAGLAMVVPAWEPVTMSPPVQPISIAGLRGSRQMVAQASVDSPTDLPA